MQATSAKVLLSKEFETYGLTGMWAELLGEPEVNGAWLIWGLDKQGKTTVAIKMANYLATITPTMYVSGEEGLGKDFKTAFVRAGGSHDSPLKLYGYMTLLELSALLEKRRAPRIVFIDNITIYHEEMKYGGFQSLLKRHSDKLFVFLAHEDKKRPFTSSAMMCSRYAKIKIHVEGLAAFVSGRCPGGTIIIDEDYSQIYWGESIRQAQDDKKK